MEWSGRRSNSNVHLLRPPSSMFDFRRRHWRRGAVLPTTSKGSDKFN
jgi:hypothetical protein